MCSTSGPTKCSVAKCPQVCLTSGDRRRLEDGGGSRWCMEEDGRMGTSVPSLQSPPAHTGTNMVTICARCKENTTPIKLGPQ